MMAGGGKKKTILDLLSNPNSLQAQIKAHEDAIAARTKAAEDYNRNRLAAQAAIEQLVQKQAAHDDRQKELDATKDKHSAWEEQLNLKQNLYVELFQELQKEKDKFEEIKANALKALQEQANQIAQKKDELDRRQADLTKKLSEAEVKHYALLSREVSVNKREAFLIGIINQLKA